MVIGGGTAQGDGPSRQEATAISAGIIDIRALEVECKRIVQEISSRFIDLGLEDHEDDYAADQLQAKQEKFEEEFSKLPFQFDAHSLSLPKHQGDDQEALLDQDDPAIEQEWAALGSNLKDIHEIINQRALKQLLDIGELIQK